MPAWTCVLAVFLLFLPGNVQSQTVSPVFSQTLLQAPYPYRLQDWNRLPPQRLQLRLRMLDTRVGNATLYLKMEMESEKVKIENPHPIPVGISLSGGDEVLLDASHLGLYFHEPNLSISGPDAHGLQTDGILPDGFYHLRFKVFEAVSGNWVSVQEVPAMFNLVSAEPPLIGFPAEDAVIPFRDPCHIRFQWIPRHLHVATGFLTEYIFEIAEIPQEVDNWKEYFHTLPLVYSQTTTACFLDYDPQMPELLPQKDYAFRIRTRCTNSTGESLLIKNDGYSQIQRFSYRESCPDILSLHIDRIQAHSARINWNGPIQARSYEILYRKNGKPDARWFSYGEELPAGTQSAVLEQLQASTGYECKINVHCVHTGSPNAIVRRFTTLSKENAHLECGKHDLWQDTGRSTRPLEKLMRFDQIRTANGFVIEVEEAEGSHGIFSGKGYTRIPLLSNTGVKVKFKNIFINRNYELVSGSILAEKDLNSM